MKTIYKAIIYTLILLAVGCNTLEKSAIYKPVGKKKPLSLKESQVWRGVFDPDGTKQGGNFEMLVESLDASGNFTGYMSTGAPLTGNGKITGNVNGASINFRLHYAQYSNTTEVYSGNYSDQIRGRYLHHPEKDKTREGSFQLMETNQTKESFLTEYKKVLAKERVMYAEYIKEQKEQRAASARIMASGRGFMPPLMNYSQRNNQGYDGSYENAAAQSSLMRGMDSNTAGINAASSILSQPLPYPTHSTQSRDTSPDYDVYDSTGVNKLGELRRKQGITPVEY